MTEPIILATNDCHEFRIASVEELGIRASGSYDILAGAILKNGRNEKTMSNNKITRSMSITYPSIYTSFSQGQSYYQNNTNYYCNSSNNYCSTNNSYYNNAAYYCNSSNKYCYRDPYSNTNTYICTNNYCSGNTYGSTTYYCIPGTSNCSTTPYSNYNTNYYCNANNNYCANTSYNGSTTYYRSNICPTWDVACNNSYYNSTNTQYQNGSTYCTYSNNYCNNYNYNNNYNYGYNQPDLVVQRVYQNSSDKRIIAQICNQGGEMNNSVSVRTSFVSNSTTSTYNTLQIGHGQCTSTVVSTTPAELGIVYGGSYSITVAVDANNNVSESNESNNTLTQSLFLETDRNQKSDLVVDRISANDNSRIIVTHVCNIGDDMLDYNNWVMEISNTTNNSTIRNSGYRLQRGQCTDVNTSYASLGVYQSGGYNFRVVIDPDNAISEQSRYNNTLTQYLQIWFGY